MKQRASELDRPIQMCDPLSRNMPMVPWWVAAQDTQAGGLANCSGGLNIGCDKAMTPTTFFFGLIDDVRIYNRAVRP